MLLCNEYYQSRGWILLLLSAENYGMKKRISKCLSDQIVISMNAHLTIIGIKNSYAERYAKDNNISFRPIEE